MSGITPIGGELSPSSCVSSNKRKAIPGIPLPNFDFSAFVPKSDIRLPPTPVKKRQIEFVSPEAKASKRVSEKKTILVSGELLNLGKSIGSGNYKTAYEIQGRDELLVKVYREYIFRKYSSQKVKDFTTNAYEQYLVLKESSLPVAPILNTPSEDGFFVVEKVHNNVDPSLLSEWKENPDQKFEELSEKAQNFLSQLRKFVTYEGNNRADIDMNPDNFKFDNSNILTLIDFREEKDDEDIVPNLTRSLAEWAGGNYHIREYLLSEVTDKSDGCYRFFLSEESSFLHGM